MKPSTGKSLYAREQAARILFFVSFILFVFFLIDLGIPMLTHAPSPSDWMIAGAAFLVLFLVYAYRSRPQTSVWQYLYIGLTASGLPLGILIAWSEAGSLSGISVYVYAIVALCLVLVYLIVVRSTRRQCSDLCRLPSKGMHTVHTLVTESALADKLTTLGFSAEQIAGNRIWHKQFTDKAFHFRPVKTLLEVIFVTAETAEQFAAAACKSPFNTEPPQYDPSALLHIGQTERYPKRIWRGTSKFCPPVIGITIPAVKTKWTAQEKETQTNQIVDAQLDLWEKYRIMHRQDRIFALVVYLDPDSMLSQPSTSFPSGFRFFKYAGSGNCPLIGDFSVAYESGTKTLYYADGIEQFRNSRQFPCAHIADVVHTLFEF